MPEPLDESTSARMSLQRTRDTELEMRVRRILHRRGLRYRVDTRPEIDLRTKADLVFRSSRVAVFIHGCFWHRCPEHYSAPKNNASWWDAKTTANRERDVRTVTVLESRSWTVLVFWEHEEPAAIARKIDVTVRGI